MNDVKLPKINKSRNNINDSVIKEDPSEDTQEPISIQVVSNDVNKASNDNLAQDSQMEAFSDISNDNLLSQKRLIKNSTQKANVHIKKEKPESNVTTPRGIGKSKQNASVISTEASR